MTAIIKGEHAVSIIRDIKFIPRIGEVISFWYKDNIVECKVRDVVYFVNIHKNMHRIEIYI
jgi:hypothetical protein